MLINVVLRASLARGSRIMPGLLDSCSHMGGARPFLLIYVTPLPCANFVRMVLLLGAAPLKHHSFLH